MNPECIISRIIYSTFCEIQFIRQQKDKITYANDVEDALLTEEDVSLAPLYSLSAYLFNPYCVLNCIGRTTTVFSNLFLSIVFYTMLKGNFSISILKLIEVRELT